jgi:tetratricopeptide (TPR) repeat protein
MRQELIPFVESNYRTNPALRTLHGFSLGGLFALWDLLHPDSLFSRYIVVSPPLNPSTAEIFTRAESFLTSPPSSTVKVYLCGGALEPILPWFPKLTAILDQAVPSGFDFKWEILPRGIHQTAPGETLAMGLRATLGKKSIYEAMCDAFGKGGIASAIGCYQDLKVRSPTEFDFSESELNSFGYLLLYRDEVDDAIEIFRLNVAAYPDAWNTHDSLGEALMTAGHVAPAIESYRKSVALNPRNEFGIAQIEKLTRKLEAPQSK